MSMERRWNDIDKRNRRCRRGNVSQRNFLSTDPAWTDPGANRAFAMIDKRLTPDEWHDLLVLLTYPLTQLNHVGFIHQRAVQTSASLIGYDIEYGEEMR